MGKRDGRVIGGRLIQEGREGELHRGNRREKGRREGRVYLLGEI